MDLSVLIGALYHRFADGRSVPVFPYIEAGFPLPQAPLVPKNLYISDSRLPNGKIHVKIYTKPLFTNPKLTDVFLERHCDPTDWEMFQRLRKAWGYWFLRTAYKGKDSSFRDYQIVEGSSLQEGTVFKLKHRPEEALLDPTLYTKTGDEAQKSWARDHLQRWQEQDRPQIIFNWSTAKNEAAKQRKLMEAIGGPLPWSRWEDASPDHQTILEFYLGALHQLQSSNRLLWAYLRNARIFEMTRETYRDLFHSADVFTTETLCGVKWYPQGEGNEESEAGAPILIEKTTSEGKKVPFPEDLPFDCCYFAWGSGINLTDLQKEIRGIPLEHQARNVGLLVTRTGWVVELCWESEGPEQPAYLLTIIHRNPDEGWCLPFLLVPWITTALVTGINHHKTLRIEGMYDEIEHRKVSKAISTSKEKRPPPPPYYTIQMRSKILDNSAKKAWGVKISQKVDWSHRWDVAEHDMVRLRKGKLPLDEKRRACLHRAGYRLLAPDLYLKHYRSEAETLTTIFEILAGKNMRSKRPDEWMSIRVSRCPHMIKGPANVPYVPAVRKPLEMPGVSQSQLRHPSKCIERK